MSLATELRDRLQRHYINPKEAFPGGIFLPEVTLGSRRADALYVGFTTSSGKRLVGHELKVSRSDWLHELAQPTKAEAWMANCHEWYLVVPAEGIASVEELPVGWGLMMPSRRSRTRMEVVVKSTVRDVAPSWEAVHEVLKKLDTIRAAAFGEGEQSGRQAEMQRWQKIVSDRESSAAGRFREDAERLQKIVDDISSALGMQVDSHGYGDDRVSVSEVVGALRRYVRADRDAERALQMRYNGIRRASDQLTSAIGALEAAGAVMES